MTEFVPQRPDFLEAVRELHESMPFMKELGVVLDSVQPGRVSGRVARRIELTQQHGALHAGVVIGLGDQMAGLAAFSLLAPGQQIVSVNFSAQLLRRADSDIIYSEGQVLKLGKRLAFTTARIYGERDSSFVDFASLLITMAVK